MAKKESATTDVKTGGGKKKLLKDCGKLIIISTMIILVLGLGILTWKKKDRLISKEKFPKAPPPVTKSQQKQNDPDTNWSLRNEIKKLETRQQINMSRSRTIKGDPLAD